MSALLPDYIGPRPSGHWPIPNCEVASSTPDGGAGELVYRGETLIEDTGSSPRRPPRRSATSGCTAVTSRSSMSRVT